ncbi:MAG: hypothetical protein GWN00_31065 [Aliifodinibius sp.]|nr:hypothetical protein [Fodinibius sp.]NIV03630.1 hypothetical protein [Calditrichia bacterium]NIY29067.1 hypothetical protein [Fodinibius sp.]
MTNLEKQRSRYLQDDLSVRLGGLATNRGRISSFSKFEEHQEVVKNTLHESKWFIKWTAADLDIHKAAELVRLQIQLALWELQTKNKWYDKGWRLKLASRSKQWSERLLEMSGLLEVE